MNFGFALCIRPLFSDKPVCDRGVPPCSALLLPIEISLTFLFTLAPIFPVHIFPVETNANYFVLGEMQLPRAVHLSCTEGKSFWIFSLRSLLLYHIFPLCQECFEKNFNISENYHNPMVNFHNFIGRRHCQMFGLRRARIYVLVYLLTCGPHARKGKEQTSRSGGLLMQWGRINAGYRSGYRRRLWRRRGRFRRGFARGGAEIFAGFGRPRRGRSRSFALF